MEGEKGEISIKLSDTPWQAENEKRNLSRQRNKVDPRKHFQLLQNVKNHSQSFWHAGDGTETAQSVSRELEEKQASFVLTFTSNSL